MDQGSPRYLGRALGRERYVRMTETEAVAFAEAARKAGVGAVVTVIK